MQVRDSLNHKIAAKQGEHSKLTSEIASQRHLLDDLRTAFKSKQDEYKDLQAKFSDITIKCGQMDQ